jgi:hypothetical protein
MPANESRTYLVFQNISDTLMRINFGEVAHDQRHPSAARRQRDVQLGLGAFARSFCALQQHGQGVRRQRGDLIMNRLLTILLLLGATAHGQINNPPTSVNIVDATATGRAVLTATNAAAAATAVGLGTANDVTFNRVQVGGATFTADDFLVVTLKSRAITRLLLPLAARLEPPLQTSASAQQQRHLLQHHGQRNPRSHWQRDF